MIFKTEIQPSIIEMINDNVAMQNIYDVWFLKTFKKPKNFIFFILSTYVINKKNKYKQTPHSESGTPKNCEYDVLATLSQSIVSLIAHMLGAASVTKFAF